MKLKDRVALITGAGTGMGRATALLFAREGASVAVNYSRSRDEAEEVVAQIRGDGGKAIAIQASVAKEVEVIAMMRRVEQEFGRLDALIRSAVIFMHHAELLREPEKTFCVAYEKIAAGIQAIPELVDKAFLFGFVKIDHDVTAENDVVAPR